MIRSQSSAKFIKRGQPLTCRSSVPCRVPTGEEYDSLRGFRNRQPIDRLGSDEAAVPDRVILLQVELYKTS